MTTASRLLPSTTSRRCSSCSASTETPKTVGRDDADRNGLGRKVKVTFKDGETLHGYTTGYAPDRHAFFVFPADPASNNDRVFVINDSTSEVEFV